MFYKFLFISLTAFILVCEQTAAQTQKKAKQQKSTLELPKHTKTYKIIGIKDGDTFIALIEGNEQVIRLAHVDCPEKQQPFGTKAKLFASNLCFGEYVYIKLPQKNIFDRNKRLIAELVLPNGVNINKELVKNGYAWHYKKFSTDPSYAQLENEAKSAKRGLWADDNAIAPWQFRRIKTAR